MLSVPCLEGVMASLGGCGWVDLPQEVYRWGVQGSGTLEHPVWKGQLRHPGHLGERGRGAWHPVLIPWWVWGPRRRA